MEGLKLLNLIVDIKESINERQIEEALKTIEKLEDILYVSNIPITLSNLPAILQYIVFRDFDVAVARGQHNVIVYFMTKTGYKLECKIEFQNAWVVTFYLRDEIAMIKLDRKTYRNNELDELVKVIKATAVSILNSFNDYIFCYKSARSLHPNYDITQITKRKNKYTVYLDPKQDLYDIAVSFTIEENKNNNKGDKRNK